MDRSAGASRRAVIRALTAAEQALATAVFGEALDPRPVRLLAAPWPFRRAFVAGRWFGRDWIVWPRVGLPDEFTAGPLGLQAVLVHELVHVWQAQQGVNLLLAKLRAGDRRESYVYPVDDRCDWPTLNIEQQAMAVEHAFRLAGGEPAPASAAFYRSVLPFAHCRAFASLAAQEA